MPANKTDATAEAVAPLYLCAAETALTNLHAMMEEIDGVRQAEDIEYVHRMRVASRRLRSVLPLLAECLSPQQCHKWRRRLRRVTRALGAARDTDVQSEFVQTFLAACADEHERVGIARLLLRLRQRRQALQASVLEAMDWLESSAFPTKMARTLCQLVRDTCSYDVAGTTAGESYRRTRQAILAEVKALEAYEPYVEQPECGAELHAMRIAAKRLRYTLETFAPLYQSELLEPIRRIRTLQDLLGDIHDCDVWVHDLAQFLEEEQAHTLEYYGQTEVFARLVPGVSALQHNRQQYRAQRYQEFAAFWHLVQTQGVWRRLRYTLASRLTPSSEVTEP